MGYFRPDQLPRDPDATQSRRDAKLVLRVATCALRGQGGTIDPAMLLGIAQDERMPPRTQRRAAMLLARLEVAPVSGVPWQRGRA